jgi:hypothetical protein
LKPADSFIKGNIAANQAIIRYKCISCSQIISYNKGYTDGKGKPIPLDGMGKNNHYWPAEAH